jgi:MtN3 and saliva related transmembrane protein
MISLEALMILGVGLALWILYGVFKSDWVIVSANSIGCGLVVTLLIFKARDSR